MSKRPPSPPRTTTAAFPGLMLVAALCCTSPAAPQSAAAEQEGFVDEALAAAPIATAEVSDAQATRPEQAPLRLTTPPALSVFTPEIVENLRRISSVSTRRSDNVFMKVGDSSTVGRAFLSCFSRSRAEDFELAGHGELREALTFFRQGRAGGHDPFRRESLAAHEGWSARHILAGRPSPLLRELRAVRPRIALVMNGGNDVEMGDDIVFGQRMMRIVDELISRGVIPVLSSVPPRADSPEANRWVLRYNQVSRGISAAFALPYLDYHQVMRSLPNQGLAGDGVHPNVLLRAGRGRACDLGAEGQRYGHNARNLLALRGLDAIRRHVFESAGATRNIARDTSDQRSGDIQNLLDRHSGGVDDPRQVLTLPFSDLRDSTEQGSSELRQYSGCAASQEESGRESIYRLVLDAPLRIRVLAIARGRADVDVHLLGATPSEESCRARGDTELVVDLEPGVHHISVDTFSDTSGPHAGRFLLLITALPDA